MRTRVAVSSTATAGASNGRACPAKDGSARPRKTPTKSTQVAWPPRKASSRLMVSLQVPWRKVPGRRDASGFDRRGQCSIVRAPAAALRRRGYGRRSEEHTAELQALMRISYAVFCLKKKKQ